MTKNTKQTSWEKFMDGKKDGKYLFVSTANITGKCFGLEKYIKSK